jgi:hypothetical protein
MKTILEYLQNQIITEASVTKFEHYTNDIDALKGLNQLYINNPEKIPDVVYEKFIEKLKNVSKDHNPAADKLYIYALEKKFFKIPYEYTDSILQEFEKSEYFTIKYSNGSEKIKVYYGKIKLFETGEGSINNVSSTEQELATCLIWNKYIELKSQNLDFTIDIVNDIIKDISPNFTSNWVKSLAEQVNAIEVLLKRYGIPETDIANYKLCLYGSTIDDDDLHIGELYKKLITKYSKFFKGNKHHFDPSDIILYNKNLDIDSFKELTNDNITDGTQTKKLFMDTFFSTRDIMGISLKQITTTPKIEEYNINSECKVKYIDSVEIVENKSSENYLRVLCKGDFNFDNLTDEDGNEIQNKNQNIYVTLRSFGSDCIAMDCTINDVSNKTSPSLGKCPVKIWRKMLNLDKDDNITTCINAFKEFLTTNNEDYIKSRFNVIIKKAIKEGPNCFPFILIH